MAEERFSNCHHPERMPGEVFFGNMMLRDFKKLTLKTARTGRKAYDESGRHIDGEESGPYPVFVKAEELGSNGVCIEFFEKSLEEAELALDKPLPSSPA